MSFRFVRHTEIPVVDYVEPNIRLVSNIHLHWGASTSMTSSSILGFGIPFFSKLCSGCQQERHTEHSHWRLPTMVICPQPPRNPLNRTFASNENAKKEFGTTSVRTVVLRHNPLKLNTPICLRWRRVPPKTADPFCPDLTKQSTQVERIKTQLPAHTLILFHFSPHRHETKCSH